MSKSWESKQESKLRWSNYTHESGEDGGAMEAISYDQFMDIRNDLLQGENASYAKLNEAQRRWFMASLDLSCRAKGVAGGLEYSHAVIVVKWVGAEDQDQERDELPADKLEMYEKDLKRRLGNLEGSREAKAQRKETALNNLQAYRNNNTAIRYINQNKGCKQSFWKKLVKFEAAKVHQEIHDEEGKGAIVAYLNYLEGKVKEEEKDAVEKLLKELYPLFGVQYGSAELKDAVLKYTNIKWYK